MKSSNFKIVIWLLTYSVSFTIFNDFNKAQCRFNHLRPNSVKQHLDSQEGYHSSETLNQLNRYDVKFYKLDLSVSKNSTEIFGSGTIHAKVLNTPIDTLIIELIDSLAANTYMIVDSVIINDQGRSFIHNNHLIKVAINPSLPVDSYFSSIIYYHGNGEASEVSGYNGISNGSAFNSLVTYTYSEPFWSKIWWPCKQILSDKADSIQIFITTESDCKAGSNGVLKSIVQLPNNMVRYEWKSDYPIAYYLVSFAVGQYIENVTYMTIEGSTDSILIQSYLFQDCPYLPMHMVAIQKTKNFMQLFINLFGQYPFENEKYGYCLTPGSWGAMEHQTMTTTGYQALDTTAAYIYYYYFWYSAHELGHSWFGDNVTCSSWQDIWINEGFAGYAEYLALQYLESQSRADFWMNDAHQKIKMEPGGSVFVPYELKENEDRIFDYRLTYKKGAAIVHMLRFEVGNDSLFFFTLKNFQNEFKDSVATGLDFKNILEETTGKDFTDFFNQWYFGEGYPIYNINWTQINDTLKIHSVQSTSTSVTTLFKMHLDLKLHYSGGDTLIRVYQNLNDQHLKFYLPYLVTNVVVDPSNWVIDLSNIIHTGIKNDDQMVESYFLYQNYPNPFNPKTTIKYDVPEKSYILLKVYNILGKELQTLINEEKSIGSYELEFDATNLPSGIYLYRLQADSFVEIKKMLFLK